MNEQDLFIFIAAAFLITIVLVAASSFSAGRDYQRKLESVRRKIRFLNHETHRPYFLATRGGRRHNERA